VSDVEASPFAARATSTREPADVAGRVAHPTDPLVRDGTSRDAPAGPEYFTDSAWQGLWLYIVRVLATVVRVGPCTSHVDAELTRGGVKREPRQNAEITGLRSRYGNFPHARGWYPER
jgi:hypothetical protein